MNGDDSDESSTVSRRRFLQGAASITASSIPGCGTVRNRSQYGDEPEPTPPGPEKRGREPIEEFDSIRKDVEEIFDELANHPIVDNGEFVFDVKHFEERFEQRKLRRAAENAKKRSNELDSDELSADRLEGLAITAEIGRLLVAQRVMTHQIIVAGLAFQQEFSRTEYGAALETINEAQQFLENLRTVETRLGEQLSRIREHEVAIDGFDPTAIDRAQDEMVEFFQWGDRSYVGLYHAVLGLEQFENGNDELERGRYQSAADSFGNSEVRFEAAKEAFDQGQKRGQPIPQLVPPVRGIRCLIAAYRDSTGRLEDAMRAFGEGDDERATEMAMNALREADEKASRCL